MAMNPASSVPFNVAEHRAIRRMLAWFRSAADSDGEDNQLPVHATSNVGGLLAQAKATAQPKVNALTYLGLNATRSGDDYAASTSSTVWEHVDSGCSIEVVRKGDGKCIHKLHCRHVKGVDSYHAPKLTKCTCVQCIDISMTFYLDWNGTLHGDLGCSSFDRPCQKTSDMAKALLKPCHHCF